MTESIPTRYHPAHVAAHWLTALVVLMAIAAGMFLLPGVAADDPQKPAMLQTHMLVGGVIALLTLSRLAMRFFFKMPAEANEENKLLRFAARATHTLLYVMLLGMAVSGLGLYQIVDLPAIFNGAKPYPQDFFQYAPRIGHGLVAWSLLALIGLHVGAALFHQFIKKDNLLARMWFGK